MAHRADSQKDLKGSKYGSLTSDDCWMILLCVLILGSALREKHSGLLWMIHGKAWKRLKTDSAMAAVAISQMT